MVHSILEEKQKNQFWKTIIKQHIFEEGGYRYESCISKIAWSMPKAIISDFYCYSVFCYFFQMGGGSVGATMNNIVNSVGNTIMHTQKEKLVEMISKVFHDLISYYV